MRLSEQIVKAVGQLRELAHPVALHEPGVLVENLVFICQVIAASEKLMEEAAQETDSKVLREYLTGHLEEERDHAKWMADDLSKWGIDVAKVPPQRAAMELAGSQYYLIKHQTPNALLGYMAVTEGFPFPLDVLEQLENIHGKDILRCLRYHAENDPQHRVQLFETIDKLDDLRIYENAIRTQMLLNAWRPRADQ